MNRVLLTACILLCCLDSAGRAQEPATNPFKPRSRAMPDARPGTVALSDGTTLKGQIRITRDKRFRIYDLKAKLYRDLPLSALKEIRISVEKEGMEKEWRWKEGGSDVKVYTGKAYPWREYLTTVVLTNGQEVEGHLKATPVYVDADGKQSKLVIHGKQGGEIGQKLSDLVYITKIVFEEPKEESKP